MAEMSYADAAHLLRRMGFGGPPEQIQALAALGREAAVDQLLNFDSVNNIKMEKALKVLIRESTDFDLVRRWWLARMIMTQAPFQEKMTLFWHNHFATSDTKTGLAAHYQNLTLRNLALARFDDLLLAIAQDPAMLIWLDNFVSTKDRPNENWARELQELFTMGINGPDGPNYTEADVKEIARAFTGWTIATLRTGIVSFNPRKADPYGFGFRDTVHDHGLKSIYGLPQADLDGTDVIKIIAARLATARFLVKKLFAFFVFPITEGDPGDQPIIEKFAQVYMDNDHSIKALARAIFVSEEFYSQRARFSLVKNPVELIVGSVRMLNADYQDVGTPRISMTQRPLHEVSAAMGMSLIRPDDVSGWKLGLAWIGTETLLERYNFASKLMSNRTNDPAQPAPFVSNDSLKLYTRTNAADTVASFLNLLGPLDVGQDTADRLTSYLETDPQGNQVTFVPDNATIDRKVRGLVRHIMCLAEFHLN